MDFLLEITKIWQKSRDFWFKNYRLSSKLSLWLPSLESCDVHLILVGTTVFTWLGFRQCFAPKLSLWLPSLESGDVHLILCGITVFTWLGFAKIISVTPISGSCQLTRRTLWCATRTRWVSWRWCGSAPTGSARISTRRSSLRSSGAASIKSRPRWSKSSRNGRSVLDIFRTSAKKTLSDKDKIFSWRAANVRFAFDESGNGTCSNVALINKWKAGGFP